MWVTQVRLNFLSTLLDEAHTHLHNNLCASVLRRKLVTLPFNRDVQVTLGDVRAMHACLQHAQQVRMPAGSGCDALVQLV